MKIGIFSAQYLPHMGGVENYTYNLAKKMIQDGHDVYVITSNVGELPNQEINEEISIIRFDSYDLINGRYPIPKFNKKYRFLKKEIEEINLDFIIINTRFYWLSLIAASFARKHQIPCIVVEHGTSHLSVNVKIFDWIGGIYEHCLTYLVKRKCKNFYAVSNNGGKWLSHFGIQCRGVLYNAIDDEKIKDILMKKNSKWRDSLNIPEEDKIIVFTGRLIPEKGIIQLVKAFINSNVKNFHLCIAGEGNCRSELEELINDRIHILGRISFTDVISLLDESDYFILPSDSEGFSTSILEAGICGCYIISSDVGGIREVLLSDCYGKILNDNNEDTIYSFLKQLPLNEKDYNHAIQLTRERIQNNFIWSITYKKLMNIINELI